ncbi:sodium-dependent nutrient amino acid transporter 1-like protein, partial [Dinothrombium tinctorium]
MSVGLGNVWRFPHAAYSNGGGAFLILYLLLLFIIGRPLHYMQLILGQFSGRGPIKVWKCVPALKDEVTWLNWRLCLCLIGSWILVYLSISKDRSLGKAGPYIMNLPDNYGVGTATLSSCCNDQLAYSGKYVGFIAPITLLAIFTYGNYQLALNEKQDTDKGIPTWGLVIGWASAALAILKVPFWILLTVLRCPGNWKQKINRAFKPTPDWAPIDPEIRHQWYIWNLMKNEDQKQKYYINSAFV